MNKLDIVIAHSADARQIAEIHVRTSQSAYRGLIPDALLASLDVSARTAEWQRWLVDPTADVFVARNEQIIGFCDLIACRDSDMPANTGEIAAIYVDPAWQGHGVGGLLMHRAIIRATERGFRILMLWALRDNSQARSFYEAKGFRRDGAERLYGRARGLNIYDVRYRRTIEI